MPLCNRSGCTNIATCMPHARMWAVGRPKLPGTSLEMAVGLPVCAQHLDEIKADPSIIFSDAARVQIGLMFRGMGRPMPDLDGAEIFPGPIVSIDDLRANGLQEKKFNS